MERILIKYKGTFKNLAGKEEEYYSVPRNVVEAKNNIMDMVKDAYGIIPPFVMLFDSVHIARILKNPEKHPVRGGMEIILLPVISGG